MSDAPLSAGELRQQITLQTEPDGVFDSQNQPVRTPVSGATIHAKVVPDTSEQIELADQKTLRTKWKIWIRYRTPFTSTLCLYRGKTLRFDGNPTDVDELHRWLYMKATEDPANV